MKNFNIWDFVKLCDLEKYLKLKPPNFPIGSNYKKINKLYTFFSPLKNFKKYLTSKPFCFGRIKPNNYKRIIT
jgi:hypothetical protein